MENENIKNCSHKLEVKKNATKIKEKRQETFEVNEKQVMQGNFKEYAN